MRTVVRNSFARQSILAERVSAHHSGGCTECGQIRQIKNGPIWLYRFHVDDDQGPRQSGAIAGGKLFCSRSCAEMYIGQAFAE